MTHERDIQAEGWKALSRFSVLFRNNVGKIETKQGRWIEFGLVKGSSDHIGWTSITITPDMVGKKVAVFTGIEWKSAKGMPSPAQLHFMARVKLDGGYAGIARSTEDALEIIGRG